jgi:hypothetical protein
MSGDQDAFNQAVELVYPEMRRITQGHLSKERPGHVLQTTALVKESYIRLAPVAYVMERQSALLRDVGAGDAEDSSGVSPGQPPPAERGISPGLIGAAATMPTR